MALFSLLGRKVMTNLDSMLKSRDITLPTKVHLVKAVVFPVVIYGCESWTIRKIRSLAKLNGVCVFEVNVVDQPYPGIHALRPGPATQHL